MAYKENIKVLFIDDDSELGNNVTYFLQKRGIKVHFQTTLAGTKGVIKDLNPDVIILDIEIGEENGINYISAVKDILPEVPIIIASSYINLENKKKILDICNVDFLKKPYDIEELALSIDANTRPITPYIMKIGDLLLNTQTRELIANQQSVKRLSSLEHELLKYLYNNEGDIQKKDDIITKLWSNKKTTGSEYTLNNLIKSLRDSIAQSNNVTIITIRNSGIMLKINNK